ncbi:MAG: hypothetical protein CSA23_02980 [Deltaproteobacteria bacterium]|nr:MAG: hypothetical protein CSA23_02980 [Deltaproteobacteria bacterium]
MTVIPSIKIYRVLSVLADSGVSYRLLRNIDNELPENLKVGKDIDILVRWKDIETFENLLKENGFKKVPHPFFGDQFLYGVHPFRKYRNTSSNFFIDCHFELACRSLNQGEWIPLDRVLQERAWRFFGYHRIGKINLNTLDPCCEWIHLLTRCIFDKRLFSKGYTLRIRQLSTQLSDDEQYETARLVFFKFTEPLLNLIRTDRFSDIIREHLTFKDY